MITSHLLPTGSTKLEKRAAEILKSAVEIEIVLFARIYLNLFVNLKDKRIIMFK